MKNKLLAFGLALAFASGVYAQKSNHIVIPESKLKFAVNDSITEITITDVDDSYCSNPSFHGKWLEIPEKIQGIPVTTILDLAFAKKGSNTYKIGLWIPDSVKTIGKGAFSNSYFDSIHLPDGLEVISGKGYSLQFRKNVDGCFYGCKAKNINIPSTVNRIENSAFVGCNLESVDIPKGCTIEEHAFDGSGIKKLTFPNGRIFFAVEFYQPFANCNNLETIVTPKELDILWYMDDDDNLADFISGEKISSSISIQIQLKSIKVRAYCKVRYEEALVLYNKAVADKNWEKAKSIAEEERYYNHYKRDEWDARIDDMRAELYFPAIEKSIFESGQYYAVNSNGEPEGIFIPLTKEIYNGSGKWFRVPGSPAGLSEEVVGEDSLLEILNKKTKTNFTVDYRGTNGYCLLRPCTNDEIAYYNQKKMDIVKNSLDKIEWDWKYFTVGNSVTYGSVLPSNFYYDQTKKVVHVLDSNRTVLATISESKFLSFLQEIEGFVFTLDTDDSRYGGCRIYRSLTYDEKCFIAFAQGQLHTNLIPIAIVFEEKKGVVYIKGFKEKGTVFENAGLKEKDVIKEILFKYNFDSESEKVVNYKDLMKIGAPATIKFIVDRKVKKEIQTLEFTISVEWNQEELKKLNLKE